MATQRAISLPFSLYIELDLNTMHLNITINYKLPNETTDEININTGTFTRSGDLLEGNN